ncbi:hypothetical protein [Aeromonas dhakensis]|uniref:hypothetical protein n=1 Tax=Aeromonas dhakensis TaxID=196024 RepID=UPI002B475E94|nr:hypothetical protein [Aeromonas dhakensis]
MFNMKSGFQIEEQEIEQQNDQQEEQFQEVASTIDQEFEAEIRRFIRTCYWYGLKDDWIESMSKAKPNPSFAGMTGIPRDMLVDLMRDELNALAEVAERDRELEAERIGKLHV